MICVFSLRMQFPVAFLRWFLSPPQNCPFVPWIKWVFCWNFDGVDSASSTYFVFFVYISFRSSCVSTLELMKELIGWNEMWPQLSRLLEIPYFISKTNKCDTKYNMINSTKYIITCFIVQCIILHTKISNDLTECSSFVFCCVHKVNSVV